MAIIPRLDDLSTSRPASSKEIFSFFGYYRPLVLRPRPHLHLPPPTFCLPSKTYMKIHARLSRSETTRFCQAWVGKIAPQGGVSVPLTYTVEWPFEKEIEMLFG